MTVPVGILPDALSGIEAAAHWYEGKEPGLGSAFVRVMRGAIASRGVGAGAASFRLLRESAILYRNHGEGDLMKKAALVLAGLYVLVLLVLTVPVLWVCFGPAAGWKDLLAVFGVWIYWVWLALMVLCAWALLALPAGAPSARPVVQRRIWGPVIAAGFLMGCLAFGMACAAVEFLQRGPFFSEAWQGWTVLGASLLLWLGWALLFARVARQTSATDAFTRQCRRLMQGSILALLVAVPTHIVARNRGYCCAGMGTFVGIVFGLSVMLLAFGPGVLALYAARWRARHPEANAAPGPNVEA